MVRLETARTAPTCVWMDAGVLSYKLCDRDGDCANCPLDAALRGIRTDAVLPPGGPEAAARDGGRLPSDRRYAPGHAWVRPDPSRDDAVRVGLDGFAAALLGPVRGVRWAAAAAAADATRRAGEVVCRIDVEGTSIAIGAPIDLYLERVNERLARDPGLLSRAPYGAGWLVDARLAAPDRLDTLLSADEALVRARAECRRLRTRIVTLLLRANDDGDGLPSPADLRAALAGRDPEYADLLHDLIR